MARDTAEIGSDVVIGANTPDVEKTVEALIRAYNRQPLDSNITVGQTIEWDGTDWIPVDIFEVKLRDSTDRLPSSADGAEWLQIDGANVDDYFDHSFYEFGAMTAFRHASRQWEVFGWNSAAYQPIVTFRIFNTDDNEVQFRNPADTDALRIIFAAGAGVEPRVSTEDAGTGITFDPQSSVTFKHGASAAAGDDTVIIQAAGSQTGDLLDFRNSGGATVARVSTAGVMQLPILRIVDGTLTTFLQMDTTNGIRWVDSSLEQTTVGAAGAADALPANPTKYLFVSDSAGNALVIPAYARA